MTMLAAVEKGDGTLMYSVSDRQLVESLLTCDCSVDGEQRPWGGMSTTFVIACGDAPPQRKTLDEALAFYDEMSKDSSFWETWPIHLGCL